MSRPDIRTRRVRDHLDDPGGSRGLVVLVDRLWPRGVRTVDLADVRWAKEVAPSTELRRWFHGLDEQERRHRFEEFVERYRAELSGDLDPAVEDLAAGIGEDGATLLFALRDTGRNHADVLAEVVRERLAR